MITCNVNLVYMQRSFFTALLMHSISVFKLQSLAIHYIENLRVVSFSVATKCYSINCARKTFSYNLSQVQEMNYAFYFYPTVHSQKSTNIIQEDICFCRTILVFVGEMELKQIYTDMHISIQVHRDTYSYRKVRTEVEINFAKLEQAAL